MIRPGIYRHYKDKLYCVIGCAKHTETEEDLVIYQALYGDRLYWTRPAAMFAEQVTINGVTQPRFAWVGEGSVNAATPVIQPFGDVWPKIDPSAFIAPGAMVIGDVTIGPQSSVWPGCVLRGDVHAIRIGARTNIQDGTIVHVTSGGQGTHIGDGVTVGHAALLHDCTIHDGAFIGMKSCVMDGAVVERAAMLATGALLTAGKKVPSGKLWAGSPAKHWRDLSAEEVDGFAARAAHYIKLAARYQPT